MKVLFVNRPNFYERPGGDSTQMLETKRSLESLGVQVDVSLSLSPDPSGYDVIHLFNLQTPNIGMLQLEAVRRKSSAPILLSTIYWNHQELNSSALASKVILRQQLHSPELPVYLKDLGSGDVADEQNDQKQQYVDAQRKLLEMVDFLLPNSLSEARQLAIDLDTTGIPFKVVPNAVDWPAFAAASPDWFTSTYGIKDFVAACGRVGDVRKNFHMLLYGLRDLRLPIVLIGALGPDEEMVELCRKIAPPGTLFTGPLTKSQLASALSAARVHALPSWYDTPGLASLEAACCDCSIVVGNRAAELEYFGDSAYYCSPASADSIRSAVISAYENYDADANRRRSLRERIRMAYSWADAAKTTLSAYNECLRFFPSPRKRMRARETLVNAQLRSFVFLAWFEEEAQTEVCLSLLEEYRTAFSDSDDVSLLLHIEPAGDQQAWQDRLEEFVKQHGNQDSFPDVLVDFSTTDDPTVLMLSAQAFIDTGREALTSLARNLGRHVVELTRASLHAACSSPLHTEEH